MWLVGCESFERMIEWAAFYQAINDCIYAFSSAGLELIGIFYLHVCSRINYNLSTNRKSQYPFPRSFATISPPTLR